MLKEWDKPLCSDSLIRTLSRGESCRKVFYDPAYIKIKDNMYIGMRKYNGLKSWSSELKSDFHVLLWMYCFYLLSIGKYLGSSCVNF